MGRRWFALRVRFRPTSKSRMSCMRTLHSKTLITQKYMSKISTNRVLSTQQPIDQQKRPKADNLKNAPLSFNRPSTDASLLSGVRKLIEHGRSFSVHSSSYHARKEEQAQQLIARQQWLQEMESGVAAFHARVGPAAKVSVSEPSKATSGLQPPQTFTRLTAADQNRFSKATNRL